jgi:hypothetical protein
LRRLPVIAFGLLALVTVAAFFIIQHLKVTTPLIAGNPSPFPSVIDPVGGGTCSMPTPDGGQEQTSTRKTSISFYLLYRSDDVAVYVAGGGGAVVDTVARDVFMRAAPNPVRMNFAWDGRASSGRLVPPGRYYFRVLLRHQDRTINITDPKGALEWVTVKRSSPCSGA